MATSRGRVSILIDAKDRASREIRQADGALGKLRASGRAAAIAITAVAAAVGGAGVALDKMAKRGGEVINVQRAFARFFPESTKAIGQMREATLGLVKDFDLMQQANQAVVLGAVKTSEEFARVASTATRLGRALGKDAAFAVESLTLGIARQSRMLLDNLGITVDVEEANQKYASANGLVAEKLTASQRQQAFFNAAMESADAALERVGDTALNNADNIQRIKTAFSNAKDEAASFVATSPAIGAALDDIGSRARNAATGVRALSFELRNAPGVKQLLDLNAAARERILGPIRGEAEGAKPKVGTGRVGPVTGIDGRPFAPTVIVMAPDAPLAPELGPTLASQVATAQRAQELATFGVLPTGLMERIVAPGATGGSRSTGLTAPRPKAETEQRQLAAFGGPLGGLGSGMRKLEEDARATNAALLAGVGAFQAVATAAIQGGENMEQVLLPAITNIAATAAGTINPLAGAAVGALGGIIGALFQSDNAMPVRVNEYGPKAERTMRDVNKDVVRDVFINGQLATDEQVRELGYRQGRIARLRGESSTGV